MEVFKEQMMIEMEMDFSETLREAEELWKSGNKKDPLNKFAYAVALIQIPEAKRVNKGLKFLVELLSKKPDIDFERAILYYLGYGYFKVDKFKESLKYSNRLLSHEEDNLQALALKELCETRLTKKSKSKAKKKDDGDSKKHSKNRAPNSQTNLENSNPGSKKKKKNDKVEQAPEEVQPKVTNEPEPVKQIRIEENNTNPNKKEVEKRPKGNVLERWNQQQQEQQREEEERTKKKPVEDAPKTINKDRQEHLMQMLNKGAIMYGGPGIIKSLSAKNANNTLIRDNNSVNEEDKSNIPIPPTQNNQEEVIEDAPPEPDPTSLNGATTVENTAEVIKIDETGMVSSQKERLTTPAKKRPIPKRNMASVRPSHLINNARINAEENNSSIDVKVEVIDIKVDTIMPPEQIQTSD